MSIRRLMTEFLSSVFLGKGENMNRKELTTKESDTVEMSRLLTRKKRISSKKFQGVAMLLLFLSLLLLIGYPIYQIRTIKEVTSGIKVKDIRQLPNQDKLKQLSNPNEIQLDDSNNSRVVGKLAIPAIELYLPIVPGAGSNNLIRGAATPVLHQKMGDLTYRLTSKKIRFDQQLLFGSLAKLKNGDLIFLTDGRNIYEYEYGVINLSEEDTVNEVFFLKEYEVPFLVLYTKGKSGQVVEARLNQIADYELSDSYFKGILNK